MRKADHLPPSCAVVTKSGNLNFLEPFGPVQAGNGAAFPLPLHVSSTKCSSSGGDDEHMVLETCRSMK